MIFLSTFPSSLNQESKEGGDPIATMFAPKFFRQAILGFYFIVSENQLLLGFC